MSNVNMVGAQHTALRRASTEGDGGQGHVVDPHRFQPVRKSNTHLQREKLSPREDSFGIRD